MLTGKWAAFSLLRDTVRYYFLLLVLLPLLFCCLASSGFVLITSSSNVSLFLSNVPLIVSIFPVSPTASLSVQEMFLSEFVRSAYEHASGGSLTSSGHGSSHDMDSAHAFTELTYDHFGMSCQREHSRFL